MYIYISKQLFDYYKVLRLVVGFGREIIYNNFVEVLSQTYSTGGFTSLFRGLFPSMCKNVPAVAIQFAVFEKAIGFFGDNIEIK